MTHLGASHTRRSSPFEHYEDQLNSDDLAAQNFEICLPTDRIGAILSVLYTSDTFRGDLIPIEVYHMSTMK